MRKHALLFSWVMVTVFTMGLGVQAQSSSYIVWSRIGEIWRMREEGGGKTQMTGLAGDPGLGLVSRHPAICSKARKVVFTRGSFNVTGAQEGECSPSATSCDIWIMDKNGGSKQNLTQSIDIDEQRPDCGLDGLFYHSSETIAFVNLEDQNIYTLPLTGGTPASEVNTFDDDIDPGWCWNRGIAFSRSTSAGAQRHRIYTWNTSTNLAFPRTIDPQDDALPDTGDSPFRAEHRFATCTKNGQTLIYSRKQFDGETLNEADVYRVDLESPGQPPAPAALGVDITCCYVGAAGCNGVYHTNTYPELAPGDTYIVFRTSGDGTDGDYEIAKAPADACDATPGQFPQYLTSCVPLALPGYPQQPGSPICDEPGPNPDGLFDTDPDWGEM